MNSSRLGAAVVAVVMLGALSGCATVGSIVDEARIGSALSELGTTVDAIDGLSLSYPDPELQANYSYRTYLTIAATDAATDDGLRTALLAARDTLSEPVFEKNPASLMLDAGERGSFGSVASALTELELDAEVSYWLAVQQLIDAPVTVNLGMTESEGGVLYQYIGIDREVDAASIQAIAAVPAPASLARSWSMPGLDAYGTFPQGAALELYSQLGEILPRADYWSGENVHGVQFAWNGDGRIGVTITLIGEEPATITSSDDWSLVLEALDATIASGVPATFSVQPDQSLGGVTVRWGECEQPWVLPDIDEDFFTALSAHGLPADAVPGGC